MHSRIVDPLERLKRTGQLKHGVEMADKQDCLSARFSFVFCNQMSSAIERLTIYPSCGESYRIKSCLKYLSHFVNTVKVHAATVDVYNLFPKFQCCRIIGVDILHDLFLQL